MKIHLPQFLVGCLLLVMNHSNLRAQELSSKITSIFIYNFAKQIEWPAQVETGDFVIGIFGNSPVADELRNGAQKIKIRNRTVVIRQIDNLKQVADIKACHILFVAQNQGRSIKEIAKITNAAPILIVSTGNGKAQSMINLYLDEDEDKVKFELNKILLEKQGLKATTNLLSLAVLI